jgi:hypothetical protein
MPFCAVACATFPWRPLPWPPSPYVGFELTIDVATGQVTVARPGTRAMPGGPSFSLLGAEAVGIQATACTFSAIPNNTKLKRCEGACVAARPLASCLGRQIVHADR